MTQARKVLGVTVMLTSDTLLVTVSSEFMVCAEKGEIGSPVLGVETEAAQGRFSAVLRRESTLADLRVVRDVVVLAVLR